MKRIWTYKIEYENGFVQYKNLIRHENYINEIIPLLDKINEIEQKYTRKKADALVKPIKAEIKQKYGEHWFTDRSPLFYAIKSCEMDLGPNAGGIHKVRLTKVDEVQEGSIED